MTTFHFELGQLPPEAETLRGEVREFLRHTMGERTARQRAGSWGRFDREFIAFTYEHALQFLTRRLWSWRAEFGGEGWGQEELGRSVARDGGDALWPHVTAR